MDLNVRNRFYWHEEWDEMINGELTASLPDSVRVEIYRALTRYGCYHDFGDIELSDTARGVISGCMRTLNAEWDAYLKQCDANRENGAKGGAPRGNRNARKKTDIKQPKTTERVNSACFPISDNDNGSDSEYDNGSDSEYDNDSDSEYDNDSEYEKDKKENEKEIEREKDGSSYEKFMNWYNEQIQKIDLPKISEMTDERKKVFDMIINEFGKEAIVTVLQKIVNSDFLCGNTQKRFKTNFDWAFKSDNFRKILEGNYDD